MGAAPGRLEASIQKKGMSVQPGQSSILTLYLAPCDDAPLIEARTRLRLPSKSKAH